MNQRPVLTEDPRTATQTPREGYQAPKLTDLGKWQAVTLVISLPVGPGSNAFSEPDSFFKKVQW
ncbi:hypothetical protein [Deinococcus sp. Leaf326]|uniref:hypothetical protein n=1 Tax=Deinococcus sp. Leaf326 TaxID=1736338 RepID=UPI0009EB68E0|nr:hypothetical protein [Deinococcus sp. Leaf326]